MGASRPKAGSSPMVKPQVKTSLKEETKSCHHDLGKGGPALTFPISSNIIMKIWISQAAGNKNRVMVIATRQYASASAPLCSLFILDTLGVLRMCLPENPKTGARVSKKGLGFLSGCFNHHWRQLCYKKKLSRGEGWGARNLHMGNGSGSHRVIMQIWLQFSWDEILALLLGSYSDSQTSVSTERIMIPASTRWFR